MALYDQIGKTYDTTRRADPTIMARLMHHLQPQPEGRYLDVACGSGNYTLALREKGVNLEGLDVSIQMLDHLRAKAPDLPLHQSIVESMPFNDEVFDGAMCTLAIHHFDDLNDAFSEVYRSIKPGRFVIFTSEPDQTRRYWLSEYFPNALEDSAIQLPSFDTIEAGLRQAGFDSIRTDPFEVPTDLQDMFLYSGKHRPEIYLDPQIRSGISTFASLADPTEVESGIKQLTEDIESGNIQNVINKYKHNDGDYLFVIAEKS
jgi:ubiquinone/menaquinone biosynthesis C-methylase UbiE